MPNELSLMSRETAEHLANMFRKEQRDQQTWYLGERPS